MVNIESLELKPVGVTVRQLEHLDRGIRLLGEIVGIQRDQKRFHGRISDRMSDLGEKCGIVVSDYFLELVKKV